MDSASNKIPLPQFLTNWCDHNKKKSYTQCRCPVCEHDLIKWDDQRGVGVFTIKWFDRRKNDVDAGEKSLFLFQRYSEEVARKGETNSSSDAKAKMKAAVSKMIKVNKLNLISDPNETDEKTYRFIGEEHQSLSVAQEQSSWVAEEDLPSCEQVFGPAPAYNEESNLNYHPNENIYYNAPVYLDQVHYANSSYGHQTLQNCDDSSQRLHENLPGDLTGITDSQKSEMAPLHQPNFDSSAVGHLGTFGHNWNPFLYQFDVPTMEAMQNQEQPMDTCSAAAAAAIIGPMDNMQLNTVRDELFLSEFTKQFNGLSSKAGYKVSRRDDYILERNYRDTLTIDWAKRLTNLLVRVRARVKEGSSQKNVFSYLVGEKSPDGFRLLAHNPLSQQEPQLPTRKFGPEQVNGDKLELDTVKITLDSECENENVEKCLKTLRNGAVLFLWKKYDCPSGIRMLHFDADILCKRLYCYRMCKGYKTTGSGDGGSSSTSKVDMCVKHPCVENPRQNMTEELKCCEFVEVFDLLRMYLIGLDNVEKVRSNHQFCESAKKQMKVYVGLRSSTRADAEDLPMCVEISSSFLDHLFEEFEPVGCGGDSRSQDTQTTTDD